MPVTAGPRSTIESVGYRIPPPTEMPSLVDRTAFPALPTPGVADGKTQLVHNERLRYVATYATVTTLTSGSGRSKKYTMLPIVAVGRHDEVFSYFFSFPKEIREMIYEYAIEVYRPKNIFWGPVESCVYQGGMKVLGQNGTRTTVSLVEHRHRVWYLNQDIPHYLPHMCWVIPEAIPTFIRKSSYCIATEKQCKRLVGYMGSIEGGLQSIRELQFEGVSGSSGLRSEIKDYLEIVKRCPGLQRLWLNIDGGMWRTHVDRDCDSEEKLLEKLVSFYSFKELFRCKNLQTINLVIKDFEQYPGLYCDRLVKGLFHWLRDEFMRRNRQAVEVRLLEKMPWEHSYWILPEDSESSQGSNFMRRSNQKRDLEGNRLRIRQDLRERSGASKIAPS
ncbi:hypothetical protein K491DRAFT_678735 [Lophiostoma macrostomum CBS 122681]|uniref:Uncharacterized protein n=1 Tax=Lophiostoma macrostomum CBS 122681 TaxID=1314788 RepID=A0A6A6T8Q0_9PLEO|nr:hypothetical protein K491DRAFT_678735 [Lophiostoma macrostomum CBS 122681]